MNVEMTVLYVCWCAGSLALLRQEVSQFGQTHLSPQTHHFPKHLLDVLSDEALLDVPDVSEEITHGCDSCSARRRYIVVILFISQFDAMSAGAGHAAQRTFIGSSTFEGFDCVQRRHGDGLDGERVILHCALDRLRQLRAGERKTWADIFSVHPADER